jgi:predicted dehydrogenase
MSRENGNDRAPLAQDRRRGDRPVRLALVGFGYWGPNLVRNIRELEEAEIVSICDLRPEARAGVKRRYPEVCTTSDFEDLLNDDSLEGIVISTPVSTHYELADAALRAGKHAFVEKPLAASSVEALALICTAREAGLVVMPGHTFLYSPPVNKVGELIQAGELGEIYFVTTSRVNLGLHQPDVSVVWDLGPHDLSILRYWLDETPSRVSATSRGCVSPDTPDVAFIHLAYPSGTIAHVELSWLAPSKLRRTAVVGSRRMVVYDDTSSEPVRLFDSGVNLPDPESFGEYQLSYRTGDILSPRIDVTEPLSLELLDFCEAVRTGKQPRSSAELGLDVIRVVEAVDESLANGGAPIAIETELTSLLRPRARLADVRSRGAATG